MIETRWRQGRRVGRTVYLQVGREPSDEDLLIGLMDTPGLARRVVDAVNAYRPETVSFDVEPGPLTAVELRPIDESKDTWSDTDERNSR